MREIRQCFFFPITGKVAQNETGFTMPQCDKTTGGLAQIGAQIVMIAQSGAIKRADNERAATRSAAAEDASGGWMSDDGEPEWIWFEPVFVVFDPPG